MPRHSGIAWHSIQAFQFSHGFAFRELHSMKPTSS